MPPFPRERYTDGIPLVVEFLGSLDLVFHSNEDVRVTLESVSYVPTMSVNLLSLHTVQVNQKIALDATGVHLLGGRLTFPKDSAGSRLNATRLTHPPRYRVLGATALTAQLTPSCAGIGGDAAGEDAGISTHNTAAGDDGGGRRIGVGRIPPCNPHATISEMVPPMRTPALPPMPPAPGVGAAIGTAAAIEIPTPPFCFRIGTMPPSTGMMVAVGRSIAAAYPPLNPRPPASEVEPPVRTPALPPLPPASGLGAAKDSAVAVEAFPPMFPPMVRVASVPSQTHRPVERHTPLSPCVTPGDCCCRAHPGRSTF